ncbi:electron transport complex subunit RsxD [Saccharospirillum sp. MSK14-1]|uniref:RnfABCDGE type electron transport complex subunit D n=1 Tax=Saccharospirillum sp. MSK14-1 TaxID=1897632 RepID=UPI000D370DF5|nr:RnfABCDGE type electron transport complex subunit D [Saccharospirillum sp. MSK14-1]PTY36307.1 electron transport complex subunit RsxD [Saccharospirillum sp. MSK14-1]
MINTTPTAPHTQRPTSVTRVMALVLAALIPGWVVLVISFSWGYLINPLLACATALVTEAALLKARGRPVLFFLKDLSALVTAVLLALALPPLSPWWMTVLGTALALIFAKHLFGGLGNNPFNPAMVAYALLLVSLPLYMTTRWANPDQWLSLTDTLSIIFAGGVPIDAATAATPLDVYKLNIANQTANEVLRAPIFGSFVAEGWDIANLAFLIGGGVLIWQRIISWHIPVALLGALMLMSLLFGSDADLRVPLSLHLLGGATMLGAFFIATDPVSAATSNRGKLMYGAGIGVLIYLIRTWGNYPDAVAFAVLLMNFAAPLIDHYSRPRVYGHRKAVKGYKRDD